MHTDLSPHLHSDECNQLIQALLKCHEDHPLRKFVGFCNDQNTLMLRCLKEERLERRRKNYEKSIADKQRLHERLRLKHSQNAS